MPKAKKSKEVDNSFSQTKRSNISIPLLLQKDIKDDIEWYESNILPGALTWVNTVDPILFYMFSAYVHHYSKAESDIPHPKFVTPMFMYEWLETSPSNQANTETNNPVLMLRVTATSDMTPEPNIKFIPAYIEYLLAKYIEGSFATVQPQFLIYGLDSIGSSFDDSISRLKQLYMRIWATGDVEKYTLDSKFPKILFVPMIPLEAPNSLARAASIIEFDSWVSKSKLCTMLRKVFLIKPKAYEKTLGLNFTPTLFESTIAYSDLLNKEKVHEMLRASLLKTTPGIKSITDPPDIDEIGGFEYLRTWAIRTKKYMNSDKFDPATRPRGILIVGPPGCGKTIVSKAISSFMGWPGIELNIGGLMAGLLGKTEQNLRTALNTIRSIGECIVLIDEVEKSLGGSTSSNRTDGGALMRVVSNLLHFMEEDDHRCIIVMTANSVTDIPAPLMRSGRIDKILFADVPSDKDRKKIVDIYIKKHKVHLDKEHIKGLVLATRDFSGAEISETFKEVIRAVDVGDYSIKTSSDLYTLLSKVAGSITPISISKAEELEDMRKWAESNAIRVDQEAII